MQSEILDRSEISTLVHRVGAAIDEARFDDLRAVFTADATVTTPGGTTRGIDAMVAQAARNHAPDESIQHVITDVLIDVDGAEASGRANLVVTFAAGGDIPRPFRRLGEIYRFDARRSETGWRLTSLSSAPVWIEGELPVRVAG